MCEWMRRCKHTERRRIDVRAITTAVQMTRYSSNVHLRRDDGCNFVLEKLTRRHTKRSSAPRRGERGVVISVARTCVDVDVDVDVEFKSSVRHV